MPIDPVEAIEHRGGCQAVQQPQPAVGKVTAQTRQVVVPRVRVGRRDDATHTGLAAYAAAERCK